MTTLLVTPLARGLFHRAIAQCGGGRAGGIMAATAPVDARPRRSARLREARRASLARSGGARGAPEAPASDLVRGMNLMTMGQQRDTYTGPMIDGQIVPEAPETAFRAGRQANVPT